MILIEFWTVDFQGRFSQVNSHKLWFFVIYIYIGILFYFFTINIFVWHETEFNNIFGVKLSLPYPFFSWLFSTNHYYAMCIVAIKVIEPSAFNVESQYFIPLLNKISWFCEQHSRGDETSMGGATQAQHGMTFQIILIFTFYFLPWEPNPFPNVRTNPIFKLVVKWKPGQLSFQVITFNLIVFYN
jgi:hypothetical protein